jgi:phospholipid/cholesterol/gamma-HCH transport system substrate-binding protein
MSKTVKVGIFVVVGVTLFCVGLFLIGSRAQLFASHFVVYAQFNNIDGLVTGSKVRVSGMIAGQITAIEVPSQPTGEFRLKLSVDKLFHPIVREDSLASIETEGMVGNKFVNIEKGTQSSPECPTGCTLPSQEAVSMAKLFRQASDLAQNLKGTVKEADVAIQNISSAAGHANGLIVAIKPKVADMAGNADAILTGVRQGHGTAGKLLTDKTVANNVAATIANAKQASANFDQTSRKINNLISDVQQTDLPGIHKTVENAQAITGQINGAVGTFLAQGNHDENTAAALRDTVHGAQQTMDNLADDTEAIKTNVFLRGFFNRRGFYNLSTITPNKYDASRFVTDPRSRVWISADDLFTVGSNGSQQLTDAGRSVLDDSMSPLVPYLPNNPIVVEGYATGGKPDQQYLVSRQRAIEVRNYLEQRFHLKPDRVGTMPLADQPPKDSGKKAWDGVCLALVVSQRQHSPF